MVYYEENRLELGVEGVELVVVLVVVAELVGHPVQVPLQEKSEDVGSNGTQNTPW